MGSHGFTTSLDKTCRIYDLAAKTQIRQIQVISPILFLAVDPVESFVYLACDNLNIYIHQLRDSTQKKVLTHKKKISSLCLTQDRLISGDVAGVIYIWSLASEDYHLKTFDLHKEKGAVTNLVAFSRPLSLFGLTANMQGYEPNDLKSLQKTLTSKAAIGIVAVNLEA